MTSFAHALFVTLAAPVLLAGAAGRARLSPLAWRVWQAALGLAGLAALWRVARAIGARLQHPAEWDFLPFWISARIAAQGGNFYDPALFMRQELPLAPSPGFVAEVLRVGYAYPPTSMLVMLPLGWFDFHTAQALWYALQIVAFAGCAWFLTAAFCERPGWLERGLVGVLLLLFSASFLTFDLGQSNFLVLLFVTLFARRHDRSAGGVFLALAALVKPYIVVLGGWLLLRRAWRPLAGMAVVLGAAVTVSLLLFGTGTVMAYLGDRVVDRYPPGVLRQAMNQSLLAVTLRWPTPRDVASPLTHLPFLVGALPFAALTIAATWSTLRRRAHWSLAAGLMAAVIVYPGSLKHYAVMGAIPALVMWRDPAALPGGVRTVVALATFVFALNAWSFGESVFVANVLMFAACTWAALGARTDGPLPAPLPAAGPRAAGEP